MELAKAIGVVKHRNRWSLLSVGRWREIIASRTDWGSQLGLSREFLAKILASVHEESIRVQGDEADERRAEQKNDNHNTLIYNKMNAKGRFLTANPFQPRGRNGTRFWLTALYEAHESGDLVKGTPQT